MKQIDENKLNQLLEFVKNFQIKEGRSPSIRQVANALNITSTATAQKYVKKLKTLQHYFKNLTDK